MRKQLLRVAELPARQAVKVQAGRWEPARSAELAKDAALKQVTMHGSKTRLSWETTQPRTILLVKKQGDPLVTQFAMELCEEIRMRDSSVLLLMEHVDAEGEEVHPHVQLVDTLEPHLEDKVDLVVTLGGDGTILHVSKLFQDYVPPVLSFSMGSLGFLMAFKREQMYQALDKVFQSDMYVTPRMRLACRVARTGVEYHCVNELAVHRGGASQLLNLRVSVNGVLLTHSKADGLVLATPTGSTAYSVSAGGSMVHPTIQCILLTPVSPRSLSFRPIILPKDANVKLTWLPRAHENSAVAFFDGDRFQAELEPGDEVDVRMSPYPLMTINNDDETSDWVGDICSQLRWNQEWTNKRD